MGRQHKAGVRVQPRHTPSSPGPGSRTAAALTTEFGFVLFRHKCCTVGFLILYLQILVFGYAKNKLCPD